jgi:hypothetical protein
MNREQTLTARYQSRAQAESAAKELQRSGIPRERVAVVDPAPEETEGKFLVVVRCAPDELNATEGVLQRTVPEAITNSPAGK